MDFTAAEVLWGRLTNGSSVLFFERWIARVTGTCILLIFVLGFAMPLTARAHEGIRPAAFGPDGPGDGEGVGGSAALPPFACTGVHDVRTILSCSLIGIPSPNVCNY